ncbi:hypothetical protein [Laspinema olomoucense]|uniref:Uncharacterized protein n=1 Tax=Laspinema olomoucense D3b TaxID=2953688 RepID=A0ABT2NG24_9CYAN|nr:hypothetical protein [Laspinema sp. D3b]MCT7981451.1 hypothetical protein [Laspinema sp. D3b]
MNELTDRNGRPLKGAALQARLSALQRQELETKARQYLQKHPPLDWPKLDIEEKIPVLVSLNNLLEDSSGSSEIQTINIQTIDAQQTKIKWADLAIFQAIKASGYICAMAGGTVLLFLTIHGGEISDVKDAGTTFGAGVALIKFCYDQENKEET